MHGITNEAIELGASPEVKLTVLQLWATYLGKIEAAFTSTTKKCIPKLAQKYYKRYLTHQFLKSYYHIIFKFLLHYLIIPGMLKFSTEELCSEKKEKKEELALRVLRLCFLAFKVQKVSRRGHQRKKL